MDGAATCMIPAPIWVPVQVPDTPLLTHLPPRKAAEDGPRAGAPALMWELGWSSRILVSCGHLGNQRMEDLCLSLLYLTEMGTESSSIRMSGPVSQELLPGHTGGRSRALGPLFAAFTGKWHHGRCLTYCITILALNKFSKEQNKPWHPTWH